MCMCMSSLFIPIVFLIRRTPGGRAVADFFWAWNVWGMGPELCCPGATGAMAVKLVAQDAKNQPKIGLQHLKKTNRIRI